MPPASLETRVHEAVAAAVKAATPKVPASQLYVRVSGIFVPERDKLPALLACATPGREVTSRRMMGRKRSQVTVYTTVVLADAANANLKATKAADPSPDWRTAWRLAVLTAVAGHRLVSVSESVRVFADAADALDMAQFEASNLWWSAVTFRTLCRVDTP